MNGNDGKTMKWEYLSVARDPDSRDPRRWHVDGAAHEVLTNKTLVQVLNTLGRDGWELTTVAGDLHILKRQLP